MDKKKKKLMIRRIIVVAVLVILLCLVIFGVSKLVSLLSPEKVAGNYSNNNMGLAIESGSATYYNKYEKGIFKLEKGEETQITDHTAYSITVVGDTIYYITVSSDNTIDLNSVKTDGQDVKKIKTLYTANSKFYINDGYAYYISNKDQTGINKINLENSEEKTITVANIQDFVLDKDTIYYTDNLGHLYSINLEGNNLKELSRDYNIKNIQILGKWIYFYSENENALCKIKKNGKSKKTVATFVNNEMYNVTNKKIYYYDAVNKNICKSDLKGKKSKVVVSLEATRTKINIANGIIYYLENSKDNTQIYQMFRVKESGKEYKPIEY